MRKLMIGAALAALMTPGLAAADDCGEVTITEMNWASSAIITNIAKFLMEEGYGCSVVSVPSSTTPSLVSVAETGKPDIVTELWINGAPSYQELQDAGKIMTAADVLADGGREGWWVPQYMVDAHPELATIEGVKANVDLLGGRFHNCPDGWACKNTNADLARNFGLVDAGFEIFLHGSGETLATSIASAYANEEPWIGYYWSPDPLMAKYKMVEVDLGVPYDHEVFTCAAKSDCSAEGVSSWPIGPVKTVVTTDFADRAPEIAELMSNMSFKNADVLSFLDWMENNGATYEETAVHFLTTRQDLWSEWINDSAKENLAALLP
ncbi:ABC transporter substrate-binding protein [Cognatishimia sp. WU-CL00825]|uniref:ABC transporter substrate-binding protein n=1 Tax=Cognatishimia sp. WU-CL00825 TaxID=3127658 RepID=UPI003102FBF6